jgi:hypothetical protein
MSVATFEATVEDGLIRLPDNVRLPNRTKVYVVVPQAEVIPTAFIASPRLAHPEQVVDFRKEVTE